MWLKSTQHLLRLIASCFYLASCAYATDIGGSQQAEQMLEQAFTQLNNNQQAEALSTLDQLIQRYPHFQLAQLMRADLLYAQAHQLQQIGQPKLTQKQSADLQAEARARLHALKRLADQQVPDYLLTIPNSIKHIIAIDLTASRAYLFSINEQQFTFSGSFYFSQGKAGAGKEREGDKGTPIGMYRLAKPIPSHRLSDFYGSGALPLDYPNTWDKLKKRTGYGIWLHGTPTTQYSRPPLASDGCVVFSNDDMSYLLNTLDWRRTLVITDKSLSWNKTPDQALAATLKERLEKWRATWQSQQIEPYMAFYAPSFTSQQKETIQQWQAKKSRLFSYNIPIDIQLTHLNIVRYPGEDNLIVTQFEQHYQRSGKIDIEQKRLWWQQQDNEWRIVHEEIVQ